VARSDDATGRRRLTFLGALLIVGVGVSGCSTTQDEAARLQLNAARIRSAETRTVVRVAGHRLRVARLSVLSDSRGSAFVVQLRNLGDQAVADLPISVGVREPHRGRVFLNATSSQELSYFDAHVPTVAAGRMLNWVYTTSRSVGRHAQPFALVGDRPSPVPTRADEGTPPIIRTRVLSRESAGGGQSRLRLSLRNTSSVPQYQLQVYAIGIRGRRAVAAGELTVPHLGSHRTEALTFSVIGPLTHVRLELAAVPTIFQ
jgi:hypothetical protein